ncbi:hypothetical protein FB459_2345 [Yimella lutea]|uniref:Primosomal protein n=1 Tax=Yimella lutea TaxID=587872 RepID=A0A542EHZ0_9MICO|nr:DNA primase [Yimella lutea]TQJ14836.1 hypothetical protein FB459_2345 [Yimella lutea]
MSVDPRAALSCFINAVERHFELASSGRGNDDPHVQEAADSLADAFETYEDALYEAYGLNTPFFLPADEDDFDDDLDEDEDSDDDSDDEDSDDEEEDDDDEVDLSEFEDDDDDDEPYRGFEVDDIDYESE